MSFLEWPCELIFSACTFFVMTKAVLALILCVVMAGMISVTIKEIIKNLRK